MNTIPPITDPLGVYWSQPQIDAIEIDDVHAKMSWAAFDGLRAYSRTNPTGVYAGKMWKAHVGGKWLLRWFGESDQPGYVTNNEREIVIADKES